MHSSSSTDRSVLRPFGWGPTDLIALFAAPVLMLSIIAEPP